MFIRRNETLVNLEHVMTIETDFDKHLWTISLIGGTQVEFEFDEEEFEGATEDLVNLLGVVSV